MWGGKGLQHGQRCRAVGDQHVHEPCLMDQRCRVPHEFPAHQRLVVGERQAEVAPGNQLHRRFRQGLGRDGFGPLRTAHGLCRPGDPVVLAEGAAQVAAVAAHRQDHAAGVEPSQRLFFYGVQRQCGDFAVVLREYPAVDARPRAAKAPAPLGDVAMMKAHLAYRHGRSLRHLCLTTSKRWSSTFSFGPMPAFCLAISTCWRTVSTPSRSGSRSPRRWPLRTITP